MLHDEHDECYSKKDVLFFFLKRESTFLTEADTKNTWDYEISFRLYLEPSSKDGEGENLGAQ